MRFHLWQQIPLLLLLTLTLSTCQQHHATDSGGKTPSAAMHNMIKLIRDSNLDGFWKYALPPADLTTLQHDWSIQAKTATHLPNSRYPAWIAYFNARDAKVSLYATLQPKLKAMQKKYQPLIPAIIKLGQIMIDNSIANTQHLSVIQKQQLKALLHAVMAWAKVAPWFDQAKAKQAVSIIMDTMRQVHLVGHRQLHQMDFDTAMQKQEQLFHGSKQLLRLYGLDINAILASAHVTATIKNSTHASVTIHYILRGNTLSVDVPMTSIRGRWYATDLIRHVRSAHQHFLKYHNHLSSTANNTGKS